MWLAIQLAGENLEEKVALLFDSGITGSSFSPDGSATCYYLSQGGEVSESLVEEISGLDLQVQSIVAVDETNWTQKCDELFEPVAAGKLNITPLRSAEDAKNIKTSLDNQILIIPGTGFGTGHHPTTFNLLKLLQSDHLIGLNPKRILDAGTGSGILAIGACRLFDCPVDGYEVDALAIENAEENVEINQLTSRINLFCQSIHRCDEKYDIVIANLYAELLEMLCSHLTDRGQEKSYFLLSGIREDLLPGVQAKYSDHGLEIIETVVDSGWAAMLLKR